jgi:hypothetical protein
MLRVGMTAVVWTGCVVGSAAEPMPLRSAPASPEGNAVIRGKAGASEIAIRTTARLAGAVDSLTWNGREFIDSFDHGRQLQSAASFDFARPGEFWAECYNPTEAGSRRDGAGKTSTSKLVSLTARGSELCSTTQMAFWLAPGEESSGRPALNDRTLSRHVVSKRIRIGHERLAGVIEYDVTFTVPPDERHTYAQFEALTGYMPEEFREFRKFVPATGKLEPLDDGPGEQAYPAVFSTRAGAHAMGIYSPDQPSKGYAEAGFGRFRFPAEKVVKWNCVFRIRDAAGIKAGDYSYQMFVAVGTLEDVRQALATLVAKRSGK